MSNSSIDWSTLDDTSNDTVVHKIFHLKDHRSFEYFELGSRRNETKDTLLIIPGTGMTGKFFTIYADFFKKYNIHAVTLSHPGQAYSDSYPGIPTVKNYVQTDLKPFMREVLHNRNVSIVGFSMGASIAAYLGSHHKRFRNIGMFSSTGPMKPVLPEEHELNAALDQSGKIFFSNNILLRLFAYFNYILIKFKEGHLESVNEIDSSSTANAYRRALFAKDLVRGVQHGMDGLLFAGSIMGNEWDINWETLSDKNVLIVSGITDDRCPREIQKYIHRKIKQSKFEEYEGAHIDLIDKFEKYILQLLNK
jgi:pimeloyl-ACP methyl ester carboxylesterase